MLRRREADGHIASRESRRRRTGDCPPLRFVSDGKSRTDTRFAARDSGDSRDLFGGVRQLFASRSVVGTLNRIGGARGKWTVGHKVDLHLETLPVRGRDILKYNAVKIGDLVDQISHRVIVD